MWLVIALAVRFGGRSHGGNGFVRDTVTRFMGLIVIAMGVQFALTGIAGIYENQRTLIARVLSLHVSYRK